MKTYRNTLVLLALCATGCATFIPVPEAEKELQFIETVTLDKDKSFDSTVDWFAETFVDSKEVLELRDKERGKIIGKGVIQNCYSVGPVSAGFTVNKCRVTIVVEIKDGRIRTTYKDITALGATGQQYPMIDKGFNDQARLRLADLHASFVAYLSKKKTDANW